MQLALLSQPFFLHGVGSCSLLSFDLLHTQGDFCSEIHAFAGCATEMIVSVS